MFDFFRKKEDTVKVIDKIWMTESGKWKGILGLWKTDPEIVIICWFNETRHRIETLFARETASTVSLFITKEVHGAQLTGKNIIFAEHHPLRKKEQEIFLQWHLGKAIVHSALDEPLFRHFGGEKIVDMMKKLGMQDDSMIEHKMISNAIVNAQEKIEDKCLADHAASSQAEWMERNLPA